MKRLFALPLAIAVVGCASSPTVNRTDAASSPVQGQEYLNKVVPASTRAVETERSSCPSQSKALAGKAWKQQVAAANACATAGRWNMVELIGARLAETHHMGPWGAYYLSLAAEQKGDMARANWMIELALKKAPSMGLLVYQQARLQWRLRDQASAQKSLLKAADLDPRLVDAQMLLGQMALSRGDAGEAGKRFRLALDTEPRLLPALLGYAEVAIQKKDIKSASESLDQAIFSYPNCTRARLRRAEVLETMEKNLPEALAAYRRVRNLQRERKLDADIEMDLESKIRQLEAQTQQTPNPNQLSEVSK